MFITLPQGSKSTKFLQTDARRRAGTYEKKHKLFTRICYVCLGLCETSIASYIKVMFLLIYLNSNLHFKDLVETDAQFLLFLWTKGHCTGHRNFFSTLVSLDFEFFSILIIIFSITPSPLDL